jgi:hypothetical protein
VPRGTGVSGATSCHAMVPGSRGRQEDCVIHSYCSEANSLHRSGVYAAHKSKALCRTACMSSGSLWAATDSNVPSSPPCTSATPLWCGVWWHHRYLDGLIGPWPEAEELYRQRSPLFSADNISAPVALFQVSGDGWVDVGSPWVESRGCLGPGRGRHVLRVVCICVRTHVV